MPAPPTYSVDQYLRDIRAIRATGSATAETSFYPPLTNLFNAAGDTLKPKVLFSTQLRNDGAGQPDGGFFPQPRSTSRRAAPATPQPLQLPERGAAEIKPADYNLDTLTASEQTLRYLRRYGQVLLTNLREFRLITLRGGHPHTLERYILATTPEDLWHASLAPSHNQLLPDFLRRVMLYQVPLTNPKDVAWFLASYAREARARAEQHDLPFFRNVKLSLEESLGIQFEGDRGDHFFRSTLVQTLFYGIFSAWILWRRPNSVPRSSTASPSMTGTATTFNWRLADDFLHVPILRKLFREVSDRRNLNSIQITEILDLAESVLNRVQPSLFDNFRDAEAVAYFYEPFLEAFDPELRKQLGVWYTPREIVQYMVERVDHLLRTQLAQPLGLASQNVRILDPCCGTGAYLTQVLHRIHRTLLEEAGDDTWQVPDRLRTAALNRVFGFEIMPAPFVIAHMELSRLLEEAGAPLNDDQRAGVFLTNALTGWEPVRHPQSVMYEEMEQEREAADEVKQQGTILVILGNPPYNGYAGIATIKEERGLTLAYRNPVAGLPAPQGQGLNDLYIRFFRIAERRIAQNPAGQGIVSFISNNAWLDGLSHTSMRSHFLHSFQQLYIDNLNGDKYRTGKTTPEGKPDPSAFSTASNREGIQVGTAIATLIRSAPLKGTAPATENNAADPQNARPVLLKGTAPATEESTAGSHDVRPVLLKGTASAVPPGTRQEPGFSRWGTSSESVDSPAAAPPLLSFRSKAEESASAVAPSIHLRDLWGAHKLSHLERESRRDLEPTYIPLTPNPALGLPFAQRTVSVDYTSWPRLPELLPTSFPGIKTSRDPLLVDVDRAPLIRRMNSYLSKDVSDEDMKQVSPIAMTDAARFDAAQTRNYLIRNRLSEILLARENGVSLPDQDLAYNLTQASTEPYLYRPFDQRWLFWESNTKLLDEKREDYWEAHYNAASIVCSQSNRKAFDPPCLTRNLASLHVIEKGSTVFPSAFWITTVPGTEEIRENYSDFVLHLYEGSINPEDVFFYALAIMHTPQYRLENAGALLGDWPRIPLPATAELLAHSASLGRRLAELLDAESTLDIPREFTFLAALKLPPPSHGIPVPLEQALRITAGWGSRGQGSTVMPGRGRLVERPWTPAELTRLQNLSSDAPTLLGATCVDVYLNSPTGDEFSVFWSAVPSYVWNYTLGGYQVLKKWLSYREQSLLGRPLRPEEAAWFSEVVRRIAAILLLGPALDASYAAILPNATGLPGV